MTAPDIHAIKSSVVTPALKSIGLGTPAAINLVAGIGLVESGYVTRRQYGGGPALGWFQMEPLTHDDCWSNFLNYRPLLANLIYRYIGTGAGHSGTLVTNDQYAAIMCRVKLYRSPAPLPAFDDAIGMANYHKVYYNSYLGKASATENEESFQKAIDV